MLYLRSGLLALAFFATSAVSTVASAQVRDPEVAPGAEATAPTTTQSPAVGASASVTAPEAPTTNTVPVAAGPARAPWGHRNQLSLRLAGAVGYYVGIKYGNGDPCGADAGATFCPQRSPVMVDTALGFGVAETLELEARFRVGEVWWNGSPALGAGLGLRWYSSEESPLKFVLGVAGLVDFSAQGRALSFRTDVQARAEEGLQYDVNRYFGFYFQAGETIGFVRALSCVIDAGLGVQVRLP